MSSNPSGDRSRASTALPADELGFQLEAGIEAEEILIATDEPDFHTPPSLSQQSRLRIELHNRAHARYTEVTLFEGDWLSIRHHSRSKAGHAQLINLKFVDPTPNVQKYLAKKSLGLAAGFATLGIVNSLLALFSIWQNVTIVTAACAFVGMLVAFAVFMYRTQERFVFHTRNGRAPVILLLATLGSFRKCRRFIPQLSDAINDAQAHEKKIKEQLLREEMREHYRLTETGVLSKDVCSTSTQKILDQFD